MVARTDMGAFVGWSMEVVVQVVVEHLDTY